MSRFDSLQDHEFRRDEWDAREREGSAGKSMDLSDMLRLRKEMDPDAPDMIVLSESAAHQFAGHADAPTTWCVAPDSRTDNGYCGQPKDAAIHANLELAEELRKAIFDVELMIETNQVTDGPRNQKERAEQAERHALVGRLTKIRRALYRSKDVIENLEA